MYRSKERRSTWISIELDTKADASIEEEDFALDIKLDDEDEKIELSTSTPQPQSKLHIDRKKSALEMGIDEATYNELLQDYIDDLSIGVEQLKDALSQGDNEELQKIAIRLKGMSDNMRIDEIAELLKELASNDQADRLTIIDTLQSKVKILLGMV